MKRALVLAVVLVGLLAGSSRATSTVSFAAPTSYAADQQPWYVATGDLNGDGKIDAVVPNLHSNSVSVFLGDGTGGFGAQLEKLFVGTNPGAVAIADFNGDGKQDVAVANGGDGQVALLAGDGSGGLGAPFPYNSGAADVLNQGVALGDFDGDGNSDVVVSAGQSAGGFVSVFPGDGAGGLGSRVSAAAGQHPERLAVGDLNGDGRQDIVVAVSADNAVSVLLGNGDGTFATAHELATGTNPSDVAIGDVNGDGSADLVVANYDSNTVSVLLGNGDGTFGAQTTYATGTGPESVALTDVDGDGRLDVVVAESGGVSILLGVGDGTFAPKQDVAVGTTPIAVSVADLNGDGKPDLLLADSTDDVLYSLLNTTAGPAATAAFTSSTSGLTASFDASSSTGATSYAWDFGDGVSGSGVTTSHTYAASGTYTVTLTVDGGATATHSVTVAAPNQPPTASFTASASGLDVGADASGSSDSDGSIAGYSWNWGDGGSGTGVAASHTYSAAGTYTVSLTVTDNGGATGQTTRSVTVSAPPPANQAPVASFISSASDLQASFDASASHDADGSIASYAWDFGDGASGTGATVSHTYASGGTYTVSLTVTDDGGATGTAMQTVAVSAPPAPPPPPASSGGSSSGGSSAVPLPQALFTIAPGGGAAGTTFAFDASASVSASGSIASYAWSFGDGTGGAGSSTTHSYASAGVYTVALTVTDSAGGASTVTKTVAVSAAPAQPPPSIQIHASLDHPYAGMTVGLTVTAAGTAPRQYTWFVGELHVCGSTASCSHTFAVAGEFLVHVREKDASGVLRTAQLRVKVWPLTDPEAQLSSISAERVPRASPTSGVGAWTVDVHLRTLSSALPGHDVRLTLSSHSASVTYLSSGQKTDPSGHESFRLSDTTGEEVTVKAVDHTTGRTLDRTVTLAFVASPSASKSTVTVDATRASADGVATIGATVTLRDSQGRPLPDERIFMVATALAPQGAQPSQTARVDAADSETTDAGGQVRFSISDAAVEALELEVSALDGAVRLDAAPTIRFVDAAALRASAATTTLAVPPAVQTGSTATATVSLADGVREPLAGHLVSLRASSEAASISPATAVTDANGRAAFQVTARRPERLELAAADVTDAVDPVAVAPLELYAPGPVSEKSSLTVAAPATAPSDGTTPLVATVHLRDAGGNGVAGIGVSLEATGAGRVEPGEAVTSAAGAATFHVVDRTPEEVRLTARPDVAGLTIAPASGTFSRLRAVALVHRVSLGQRAGLSGSGAFQVAVVLYDGNATAAGKLVSLVPAGGDSASPTFRTNPRGQVTFSLHGPVHTVTYTILDHTDGVPLGTVDVPFTRKPSPAMSTIAVAPATVAADGQSYATLTVTLRDANGAPVPTETVHAATVRGGSSTLSVTSAVTDPAGVAVLRARDTVAETLQLHLEASEDGVALTPVTLRFAPPSDPAVSASRSTVVADGDAPDDGSTPAHVTVTVANGAGVGQAGKTVTLVSSGGSSIAPVSAVTDGEGHAMFSVTDDVREQVSYSAVDATDGLELAQTAAVLFYDPLATSGARSSVVASPPSAAADGASPVIVTVTLRNAGDSPLADRQVTLTGSGTGVAIVPPAAVTDNAGAASFTVTDTVAEQVTLTASDASAGDVRLPPATVTFGAPQPPQVVVQGSGSTGTFVKKTFSATVTDPNGAAITDYAWDFGDGTTSSAHSPDHGYAKPGTYVVTLRVTDARGATATGKKTVTVSLAANTATATAYAPTGIARGAAITASGPQTGTLRVAAAGGSSELREVPRGSITPTGVALPVTQSWVRDPHGLDVFDDVPETVDYVLTVPGTGAYRADVPVTFVRSADVATSDVIAARHSARADHSDAVEVRVVLRDSAGKPTPNNVVSLAAARAGGGLGHVQVTPQTALTDASGRATFQAVDATGEKVVLHATDLTTATALGPYESSSSAADVAEATVTFQQVLRASASRSQVVAASAAVHTFQPGTEISVHLENAYGGLESGKTVKLVATGSASVTPATAVTDADGLATFRVFDGSAETVHVSVVDTTDGVTLAQEPAVLFADHTVDAATSTIGAPQSIPAGSDGGAAVIVHLVDPTGAAMSGTVVHLAASSSHSTIAPASVRTDNYGNATFVVDDLTLETVTYTAKAESGSNLVSLQHSAKITFTTAVASAAKSTVDPGSQSKPFYQDVSFTVTVRNGAGQALAGRSVRALFDYGSYGYPDFTISMTPAGPALPDSRGYVLPSGLGATDSGGTVTFTISSNNETPSAFPRSLTVHVQVRAPGGAWLDIGSSSLDYVPS